METVAGNDDDDDDYVDNNDTDSPGGCWKLLGRIRLAATPFLFLESAKTSIECVRTYLEDSLVPQNDAFTPLLLELIKYKTFFKVQT